MQHLNLALEMKQKRCLESTLAIFNPKHLWRCVSKTRYHFGEATNDDLAAIGSVTGSCDDLNTYGHVQGLIPGFAGNSVEQTLGFCDLGCEKSLPNRIQKDLMYHDS